MNETETRVINLGSCPCPICNTDRFMDWHRGGLEICSRCGHVRKSSPGDEENGEGIQKTYFDNEFAFQDDFFTRLYDGMNARRRLREIKKISEGGRALEVGVGRGNFLNALKMEGYQVEGIDLSEAVCSAVQTQYGLPVHSDTLENYAESKSSGGFDLVVMCHVLEHIESPLLALRAVSRLLTQDGILYLAVPNLSSWDAYLPGWSGYEPYHLHYFRPQSLNRLLRSEGFNVMYEKTFEPLSGWVNAAARSLRRRAPELEASPHHLSEHHARGFVWALYNVARIAGGGFLSPLRWVQSALGYGEELVVIARNNRS